MGPLGNAGGGNFFNNINSFGSNASSSIKDEYNSTGAISREQAYFVLNALGANVSDESTV